MTYSESLGLGQMAVSVGAPPPPPGEGNEVSAIATATPWKADLRPSAPLGSASPVLPTHAQLSDLRLCPPNLLLFINFSKKNVNPLSLILFFYYYFFIFLGSHLQHMEVSRLGVQLEL